jgi:hypothetical protein
VKTVFGRADGRPDRNKFEQTFSSRNSCNFTGLSRLGRNVAVSSGTGLQRTPCDDAEEELWNLTSLRVEAPAQRTRRAADIAG